MPPEQSSPDGFWPGVVQDEEANPAELQCVACEYASCILGAVTIVVIVNATTANAAASITANVFDI
jgi:hypothetical protein